jgi:hypothetical protein
MIQKYRDPDPDLDDLFPSIPRREPAGGTRAWHGNALLAPVPPVRSASGAPIVYTRCVACEVRITVELTSETFFLCQACGVDAPTARARLDAQIDALRAELRDLFCTWVCARRVAGRAVRKRYHRLGNDRDALAIQGDQAAPDYRTRVEAGIAKAQSRGDALSALLAAEHTVCERALVIGDRIATMRYFCTRIDDRYPLNEEVAP